MRKARIDPTRHQFDGNYSYAIKQSTNIHHKLQTVTHKSSRRMGAAGGHISTSCAYISTSCACRNDGKTPFSELPQKLARQQLAGASHIKTNTFAIMQSPKIPNNKGGRPINEGYHLLDMVCVALRRGQLGRSAAYRVLRPLGRGMSAQTDLRSRTRRAARYR